MKEYIDELTGLYNRKGTTEPVKEYAGSSIVSVLFMDLDNFKTVNDLYGHSEGDKLLKSFGQLILKLDDDLFPIRLGGDEFVLVMKGKKSRKDISKMIEKLYSDVLSERAVLTGFSVVSVSVGIVRNVTLDKYDFSEILHHADTALYAAKDKGKACYVFYEDIEKEIRNREIIERKAEEAISKDVFEIRYQPIIHLQTSNVVAVDVRFLWSKNENEYWETREYREIFEKNGFIKRFDMYMFERTCREIKLIKDLSESAVPFNIMLSRLSFLNPGIASELIDVMNSYGITFDDLELSIEEGAFGIRGEDELLKAVNSLASAGFKLSLTKFGYNFESIKYLPHMDVNTLRFDGFYIDNNYRDSKGSQILRTLIRMGKELKFHVVGYGNVEKDKIDFLNGCGCDSMVSVSKSEPFKRDELTAFLKTHLNYGSKEAVFRFKNSLASEDNEYTGHADGQIEYVDGISNAYGGIHFIGGDRAQNVVNFPNTLMASDSYTVSMWIKPEKYQTFVSVFYVRYSGGFMSLMPYLAGLSTSTFRIHEDINVDVWYDAICRSVELNKWSYLTISYNSFNETMRYYINGRKAVTRRDVPTQYACKVCMLGGDHFQRTFEGSISGLSVCNQSKSDDEVMQMYKDFLTLDGFCGVAENFWMDDK